MSTATTAKYSPEETQSDVAADPVASLPVSLTENSEETTSNVITPLDWHSDGCDAYSGQNPSLKATAAEVKCT